MYQIMIVEDDDKIADILSGYIEKYNYKTYRVQQFDDVKGEFLRFQPDLVILDINLPYYDGFYWCRQIRGISNVPIIFLSARVGEMDQVMAIENGGDDYLTKPFHLDVVMAKIKSALRRAYGEYAMPQQSDFVDLNGLYLNRSKYALEWQERKVILTQKEFLLLDCLIKRKEQIVPREELLEVLWDDQEFVDDNTLTVNVTRVRKKLEELAIPNAIETVRGKGYRLNVTWGSGA
ncbi:response regulator transcription factor [Pullulanibacillus sp. KACC 23026]|uniref:response regulator transcription factor n=1 Tax=Pullulanibacillus sp. KACC 23026 TaxID=3028315 RepID=UPI0023AE9928|nr:response regulator transcription factor [Pullulanibacillus sp. KACC 23026]WEG11840.1 response regulator transcription factor [Pullulanibacillus sp. KACC 23026]